MNAYEIPNLRFSLPATTALLRRRFLTVDVNAGAVYATADSVTVGVSATEAAAGEAVDVADGIVMVEAADAITAGAKISVGADGKAITAAAGIVVGTALTSAGAASELVTVKVN